MVLHRLAVLGLDDSCSAIDRGLRRVLITTRAPLSAVAAAADRRRVLSQRLLPVEGPIPGFKLNTEGRESVSRVIWRDAGHGGDRLSEIPNLTPGDVLGHLHAFDCARSVEVEGVSPLGNGGGQDGAVEHPLQADIMGVDRCPGDLVGAVDPQDVLVQDLQLSPLRPGGPAVIDIHQDPVLLGVPVDVPRGLLPLFPRRCRSGRATILQGPGHHLPP